MQWRGLLRIYDLLTALRSIKEFGSFLHGDIEVLVIVIYLSLSLVYYFNDQLQQTNNHLK